MIAQVSGDLLNALRMISGMLCEEAICSSHAISDGLNVSP
jgi:hypothetical protein